jgi:hypothetical protein
MNKKLKTLAIVEIAIDIVMAGILSYFSIERFTEGYPLMGIIDIACAGAWLWVAYLDYKRHKGNIFNS